MDWINDVQHQALVSSIVNVSVPLFEVLTEAKGYSSLVIGSSTLGYGIYRYTTDSEKIKEQRNFGDEIDDFIGGAFSAIKGAIGSAGFILNNWVIIGGVVGGGVLLYLLSGMVDSPNVKIPFVPVLGGIMGLAGSFILLMDGWMLQEAEDNKNSLLHKVGETVGDIVEAMAIAGPVGVGLNKAKDFLNNNVYNTTISPSVGPARHGGGIRGGQAKNK